MLNKPTIKQYVPLFEQHTEYNRRFAALPQNVQEALAAVLAVDGHAVITGQLAQYLLGECDCGDTPDGIGHIDIIVADAGKFAPGAYSEEGEPELETGIPVPMTAGEYPEDAIVMSLNPHGEVEEVGDAISAEELEELRKKEGAPEREFETLTWVSNRLGDAKVTVNLFESKQSSRIKTTPITLGNITVLTEEPGVIAEYVKKFATMKGGNKTGKPKYDKSPGYDSSKKQAHVEKENDLQNSPNEKTKPLFVQFKIKRKGKTQPIRTL